MKRLYNLLITITLLTSAYGDVFQPLETSLESASVKASGDELIVSSGMVERRWKWTGSGLLTVGLRDLRSGNEWVDLPEHENADWAFDQLTEGDAELVSLTAAASNDEGFTSSHLEVLANSDSGRGLANMQRRARLLGGELDIHSEPGKRTLLTLRMPLK